MLRLNTTLALVFIISCQSSTGPAPDTPEQAYRDFYLAVSESDWDRVATYLSPKTLDTFRKLGNRLSKMVGKQGDPLDFFFRGVKGERVVPLRNIEVISRGEQTAVLRVTAGPCGVGGESKQCSVSEVTLRRLEQGWVLEPEMPQLLSGGGG